MKLRTSLAFIIAGIIPLLVGCTSSSTGPDDNLPIMPLKIGNTWIGRTLEFDSTGIVTSTRFDTLRIVAEWQIDGETWFVPNTNPDVLMINRVDGLWFKEAPFADGYEWLWAKHPAAVGDVFDVDTVPIRYVGTPQGPDTIAVVSYHVVATAMEIAVPAGSYKSTKYQVVFRRLDGTLIEYFASDDYAFAPGIGPVQKEDYVTTRDGKSNLKSRWELVKVTLQ